MLLLFYPHSNSVLQLQTVAWSSWRQDCASDVKCVVLVLCYGHKSATIPNARNVRRLYRYRRDVCTRSMQWMADFAALKVVVSTIVDEVANDDDDDG